MYFAFEAKVNKISGLKNLRFIYLWFDQKKLNLHGMKKILV